MILGKHALYFLASRAEEEKIAGLGNQFINQLGKVFKQLVEE